MKAVALFSGGLDSMLAARVMQDCGCEVTLFYFNHFFESGRGKDALDSIRKSAANLKAPLKIISADKEYFEMIRSPKHGHGKNLNPCIDCKIHIYKKAKAYMQEIGADFLISGEVLGQRDMSQHKPSLMLIERRAQVEGIVVRPLSAKVLDETIPEQKGLIDRNKLFAISGRSRTTQMELAEKFNLTEYPTPAGGCLLTEGNFCRRLKDLFEHQEKIEPLDIKFLKVGRHLRVSSQLRLIVGREEKENDLICELAQDNDWLFFMKDVPSPHVLLVGESTLENKKIAAGVCKAYSKAKNEPCILVNMALKKDLVVSSQIEPSDVSAVDLEDWLI